MIRNVCFSFLLVLSHSASAQDTLKLGMNLTGIAYWSQPMLANQMQQASEWVTQNDHWVEGGVNPWNSGVLDSIPRDSSGCPLEIPWSVQGTEAPQIVACLINRDLGEPYYPAGTYVCLYDGEGVLDLGFDAHETLITPGRIELSVTPSNAGIFVTIRQSVAGNPIRNIRIYPPGIDENSPPTFSPQFAASISPFPVVRFMDWGATNWSPLTSWESRPLPNYFSYAGQDGGVPIEVMIRLSNELDIDPWFCVPHAADSVYIQRFAELVRDSLDPARHIYLEYSNEVWNGMFGQYQWVEANGPAGISHPRKYAHFSSRVFRIWRTVFGADSLRLTRVLAGQLVNSWHLQESLNYLGPNACDQISVAAYFGLHGEYYDSLRATGEASTPEQVLEYCHQIIEDQVRPYWRQHTVLAENYGVTLNAYEAGQHLILEIPGVVESYMPALWAAQEHPEMYQVYRHLLRVLKEYNSPLMMAFSHVGHHESVWGSWGHLAYLGQPLADAPKYRALVDFATAQFLPSVEDLTLVRVGNDMSLRWTALPGAMHYIIYARDSIAPGSWEEIGVSTSNIFLLSPDRDLRFFRVTAVY
ncbi:MAG: hypothetical protein H6505_02530 [Calditrichaeota bacterium]|nr:hypothetical protein [Calditrichota bacterium]